MSKLVTKLLQLADNVTRKTKHGNIDEVELVTSAEEQNNDYYDHQLLTIEEDAVNRILRNKVRHHPFYHSITVEFETGNKVFISIITKLGNVINAEFDIEDIWFDDYTSSLVVRLDVSNVDMGGLFLNTIVHILGNWSLVLVGSFFNPFTIGENGSTVRFEKKGIIRFDLDENSSIRDFIPLPTREAQSKGPVLLTAVRSSQSALQLEYYGIHQALDTYAVPEVPVQTSWVRSIDVLAALLLPIGVWVTYIILQHYLPHETIVDFSFSTYFMISIVILIFSFIVMNIPRYIYMYFETRKKWQSVFVSNNIKIQMRKLHRRIVMQKAALQERQSGPEAGKRHERIMELLLQIRDRRFLAQRLKMADEDRDRKQKVKFIIAYIICTLLEWMLLMN